MSGFHAGNNLVLNAGRSIELLGGTQLSAGGNASLTADLDIILEAAENTNSSESSGWGLNFALNPEGFTAGGNVNSSNSNSTTYTPATLIVGGDLFVDAGRDVVLAGAQIDAANAAINVGRDLHVETVQDRNESNSSSFGISLTITPAGVTGGSLNFSDAEAQSQRSNAVSSIFTDGSLDVTVGGTTALIGAAIGSRSCLLYTSPSPRDRQKSRMPSSA